MHFTPVLNLRWYSTTLSGVILTPLVGILTLFGVMFKLVCKLRCNFNT